MYGIRKISNFSKQNSWWNYVERLCEMSAPPESERGWRRSRAREKEKEDRLNEDVRGFVQLVRICSPVCVDRAESLRAQR